MQNDALCLRISCSTFTNRIKGLPRPTSLRSEWISQLIRGQLCQHSTALLLAKQPPTCSSQMSKLIEGHRRYPGKFHLSPFILTDVWMREKRSGLPSPFRSDSAVYRMCPMRLMTLKFKHNNAISQYHNRMQSDL